MSSRTDSFPEDRAGVNGPAEIFRTERLLVRQLSDGDAEDGSVTYVLAWDA